MPPKAGLRELLLVLVLFSASAAIVLAQDGVTSPRQFYQSGMNALQADRPYQAIESLAEAVAANPGFAEAHIGLARAYGLLGELDQALHHAERARSLAPMDPAALNTLAAVRIDLGELDTARSLYESVLTREPNNDQARLGLAELAVAGGNFEEAVRRYEAVRQGAPRNRRALLSLALLWEERGERSVAERYLELALRYHSDSAQVHLEAARYYLRADVPSEALRHAQIALQIREDLPEARRVLATVSFRQGEYATARQAAEELLAANQRDTAAWYLHARAEYRMANLDAAQQSYRTALRLVNDDEVIRLAYEDMLLEELPADDEARGAAAAYHFEQGAYFQEQNLFDRASAAYRRGLLLDPFSVEGRLSFAELFRYRGLEAKYLNELRVVASLAEEVPQGVQDRIEAYESVVQDSVAAEWGVDQFTMDRNTVALSLFLVGRESGVPLPEEAQIITNALRRELFGFELVDVPRESVRVSSFSEAFDRARSAKDEYFLVVDIETSDRSVSLRGTLFVGRTGTSVAELRVARTGGDRISRSLSAFAGELVNRLPLAGTIVERQGMRLLINLGTLHGLVSEAELLVVRPESLLLSSEELAYMFADDDLLGTATVERLDDMVAEARLADPGLFDLARAGDRLVMSEDRSPPPGEAEMFPVLYDRIRQVR
jgi:tetratricopeptide (TPR) repeat protein